MSQFAAEFKKVFANYDEIVFDFIREYLIQQGIDPDGELPEGMDPMELYRNGQEFWMQLPNADIDGLTPAERIEQIDSAEEAFEALRAASLLADPIPQLEEKLRSFGDSIVELMIDHITDKDYSRFEQEHMFDAAIIGLLGKWKVEKAAEKLVPILSRCSPQEDMIAETTVEALYNMGVPALECALEAAEGRSDDYVKCYLMDVVSNNGSDVDGSKYFKILQEYFEETRFKSMALVYLARFSALKVIAYLRKYIEANKDTMTFRLYIEIKQVVADLGGTVSDIEVDFSHDPEYLAYLEHISAENGHSERHSHRGGSGPIHSHDHHDGCDCEDHFSSAGDVVGGKGQPEIKVGRNDLCPCGSGKKYKKCCGKSE